MQLVSRFPVLAATPLALAACMTGPTPPEGAPPMGTPPAPAAAPAQSAGALAGKWISPSCGERTYERRISLDADGSFSAEDRVSPCPPGAHCVWSGVVIRRGKYTVAGGAIQLAAEGASAGPGQPLPPSLALDATGAPVEVLADGTRCAYVRVP